MKRSSRAVHGCGLLLAALLTLAATVRPAPAVAVAQGTLDPGIPAFHTAGPKRAMPALLTDNERTGPYFTHHYQGVAYRMADAVPDVLYQQPCYCWCSKAMGHKSLHSCFESSHGAVCATCMKEAAYTYQQTQLGKTPAEIRTGIVSGEWNAVELPGIKLAE